MWRHEHVLKRVGHTELEKSTGGCLTSSCSLSASLDQMSLSLPQRLRVSFDSEDPEAASHSLCESRQVNASNVWRERIAIDAHAWDGG